MTRVSLKEAYDNKDVVAQIYAIRDIAEGASDTADSAKTAADDAKTYVDTLGVQVEGAVQTANNASASAQASAQTVAQYDARLTEVEGDLGQAESDIDGLETGLGAVTARVTTAEGNIVTIQGRVTALETADGQNVKINNINEYAVGLTGNQTKSGNLIMKNSLMLDSDVKGGNLEIFKSATNWATAPPSIERHGISVTDTTGTGFISRLMIIRNTDNTLELRFDGQIDVNGVAAYKSLTLGRLTPS